MSRDLSSLSHCQIEGCQTFWKEIQALHGMCVASNWTHTPQIAAQLIVVTRHVAGSDSLHESGCLGDKLRNIHRNSSDDMLRATVHTYLEQQKGPEAVTA